MIQSHINAALVGPIKEFLSFTQEEAVRHLYDGLYQMGSDVSKEQKAAWYGSWPHIRNILSHLPHDVWVILEYRLPMSHQRIDLLLLGQNQDGLQAVVIELKGWRTVQDIGHGVVQADGDNYTHPDIQTQDYVAKLRFTHSEAYRYTFHGIAWLYNLSRNACSALNFHYSQAFCACETQNLVGFLKNILLYGIKNGEVQAFLNGTYVQTHELFQAIAKNAEKIKQGAIAALCADGFAPSDEQSKIIAAVMDSLKKKDEKAVHLVAGGPGSGKSYLAVLLLTSVASQHQIKTCKNKNLVALGLRNNRLLNTVRKVLDEAHIGLSGAVKFFSANGHGLADAAEEDFELIIYDEAQRMASDQIHNAICRGRVVVFLYDEGQRLNVDEGGTLQAFSQQAQKLGKPVYIHRLSGAYRVLGGAQYHQFIERLLHEPCAINNHVEFPNYEFRVFSDIKDMIDTLHAKGKEGYHVALVAAFTESPGDRKNKLNKNKMNLRVGYPLYSGFDHYRGTDLKIYWLMDEKNQYPSFWYNKESNNLTHCASIYGCQGFEADYVGVIWGRDLVWRDGQWELGPNCEDIIGKPSLKELFKKNDRQRAIPLLVNRYRIFLTRGIHGTYIYCEDEQTAQMLLKITGP